MFKTGNVWWLIGGTVWYYSSWRGNHSLIIISCVTSTHISLHDSPQKSNQKCQKLPRNKPDYDRSLIFSCLVSSQLARPYLTPPSAPSRRGSSRVIGAWNWHPNVNQRSTFLTRRNLPCFQQTEAPRGEERVGGVVRTRWATRLEYLRTRSAKIAEGIGLNV